jgi:hypothetical protein
MSASYCLNCSYALYPGQNYCPDCGQKTSTRRISFRTLGVEFLQSFVKLEQGFFRLAKGLAVKPGETAIEYADGKRKKYFSPVGFMGICIALMLLINGIFHPYTTHFEPDPGVIARIPGKRLADLYVNSIHRIDEVTRFAYKYMNSLSVLIAPWFALFLWMFFKKRRNVAEITVAYILFSAFSNVISAIIISPLLSALPAGSTAYVIIFYLSILLQTLYISWAMKTFLQKSFWRVLGVLFIAGILGFILLMVFYFFYVYRGEYREILKYI